MEVQELAANLGGVFAPISTPFREDESLDLAALRYNRDKYAQTQLQGYMAIGSNGENKSLTESEKLLVLETVVRHKGPGKIVMAGHGAEMGESLVELPIAYEGPEIHVKLDPRFVSDFLKVLDLEQTFTLQLRDAESAVVCHTDDGYSYIIMPLSHD